MKRIIKLVILVIFLFPIVVLGFFIYFSLFQNDIDRSIAITRSDWMLMWGAILGYVGTVSLGVVALYQSNQANASANAANQMTQHLIEMEHRERLAFAGVESTKPLFLHLGNKDCSAMKCFENEMISTKTWVTAEFNRDDLQVFDFNNNDNDYALIIFNIKALSSNYVKKLQVNEIEILPSKTMKFKAKQVWTDCGQFLEFGNSYKVALIIHGLKNALQKDNLELHANLFPEFELLLNVTVENLYGDTVRINWSMALENGVEVHEDHNEVLQYQVENIGFQVQEKNMSTILDVANKKNNL